MARDLPMFSPPSDPHAHRPELPSIAMGGGLAGLPAADGSTALRRHPDWIRARMPSGENYHELKGMLRGLDLNTVCEEARCPNIGECWDQRTATIMILGDTCTRACGFCAVTTGRPEPGLDWLEPKRVAHAVLEDSHREGELVAILPRDAQHVRIVIRLALERIARNHRRPEGRLHPLILSAVLNEKRHTLPRGTQPPAGCAFDSSLG
jgi:hypothetical protein